MYKVVILPLAKKDIRDAALWYQNNQKGLGKKFIFDIRERVKFIQHHPKAYSKRYNEVRTAVLDKFPFLIHYTIIEPDKIIIISAVLHTSRNPGIWKNR